MSTQTKTYRFHLPKKAIKSDCPQCSPKYRKTLSRYVDAQTGETLPEQYGRCDRESNCGYSLNPYDKGKSGISYADEIKGTKSIPREWFVKAAKSKRNKLTPESTANTLITMCGATPEQAEQVIKFIFFRPSLFSLSSPTPVYTIPEDVYAKSLGHYEQNQLAKLLCAHFGDNVANELLQQFHIGTSSRWPGACIFWYIDEQGRKRGGQIKLFGEDWHTVKYVDSEGKKRTKTSWVHSALLRRCKQQQTPVPDWLAEYDEKAERSPCLFGLPQLLTEPVDKPIAIVEAPKTAIICTHYFPDFVWLAVGALSYLKAERLAPVRSRKIILFPDLNACHDRVNESGQLIKGWRSRANQLRAQGFQVEVSEYLEQVATTQQKAAGLDLADFLLMPSRYVTALSDWKRGTILRPEESQLERLMVEPCNAYPGAWDLPSSGPAPILTTSTNQPLAEVLARCLNLPAESAPLYQFTNS